MTNVTITLDDSLLVAARRAADGAGKSLSHYLADLLAADTERRRAESVAAMDKFLALSEHVPLDRPAWIFNREDLAARIF